MMRKAKKVSSETLRNVDEWMATAEFAERVERARARYHAGEPLDFPKLAAELDVPLDVLTARFAETAKRHFGIDIRAVGRLN